MTSLPTEAEARTRSVAGHDAGEGRPCVAIVLWGHPVEDWLAPLGLDMDGFADGMNGGWLFGYCEALAMIGVTPMIFCVSAAETAERLRRHAGTGTAIVSLPLTPLQRRFRRGLQDRFRSLDRRGAGRTAISAAFYGDGSSAAMWQAMRAHGADAVIVQEYEYARFDQLARFGHRDGIPVFGTFQGSSDAYSWLERRRRPAAIAAARGLIVPSGRERDRLESRYGKALPPVIDVPNPIDPSLWEPLDRKASRRALSLPDDAVVIAWHGRVVVERKGLDVLVEAWRRLNDNPSIPKVHLALMGDGGGAAHLSKLIEGIAAPNVSWLRGYRTAHVDRHRFLSAADVYVLPSRIEGMPVAPLEAMAVGLPVVATSADGVSDIFPGGMADGGLIVPVEDPERLAHALFRMVRDPELRRRVGAAGRRRVEAFSFERTASLLAQMLARAGVPTATAGVRIATAGAPITPGAQDAL